MPFDLDSTIKQLLHIKNALPVTDHAGLSKLGEKYGLTVITDSTKDDGYITFGPTDNAQRRVSLELLESELGLYDPEVIKASQLQRLILCTHLSDRGHPVNGLAEVGRFVVDTLVLNVTAITRHWEQTRGTLHHEIFHAIDYRDGSQHYLDPEWRKLNRLDYKYNDSLQFTAGEVYSDAIYFPPFDFNNLPDTPRGFLNQYATESVHEDKAVVYSWLIVRYQELERIAQQDDISAKKVTYMKELLAKFHPSFNAAFWRKIEMRSEVLSGLDYDEWKGTILTL